MATGRNLITAIGEQVDKDTAATSLTKLLATSNTMEGSVNVIQSNALTGNRFTDEQFTASIAAGGSIGAEMSALTIPLVTKHAIGPEEAVPEDLGAGTGPYKHKFKPAATIDDWLTVLKYFSDSGYHDLFTGCKINQKSLSLTEQAIITYTLDILGLKTISTTGVPAVTPVENNGNRQFAWETKATWNVGSTNEDYSGKLTEFTFAHNNNLDGDDYGLRQERQSLDAQGGEHTNNFTLKFDAATFADLKGDLVQGNIIPVTIGIGSANGGNDPYIAFVYPKLKLSEVSAPVNGPDKVTVSIAGRALWDNTAGCNVAVEIIDDQATQY